MGLQMDPPLAARAAWRCPGHVEETRYPNRRNRISAGNPTMAQHDCALLRQTTRSRCNLKANRGARSLPLKMSGRLWVVSEEANS